MNRKIRLGLLFVLLLTFLSGCSLLRSANINLGGDNGSQLSKEMQELKAKYNKESPYEIQEKTIEIKDDESITFPTNVSKAGDFESIGHGNSVHNSFEVYGDSNLKALMISSFRLEKGQVEIQPGHNIVANIVQPAGGRQSFQLAEDKKSWGVYDTLYLLQRDDAGNGKKLSKPKLWVVKINKKGRDKIAIQTKVSLVDNGSLQMEWTEVPGADTYSIVKRKFTKRIDAEAEEGDGFYQYEEIDRVQSTVYRTEEPQNDSYENLTRGGRSYTDESSQRQRHMRSYEEEFGGPDDHVGEESPYDLFVVPMKGHQPLGSISNFVSSDKFTSRMPDRIAPIILANQVSAANKEQQIPKEVPLQMMDGSIHNYPLVYEKIEGLKNSVECTVSVKDLPSLKASFYVTGRSAEDVQKFSEELKATVAENDKSGVLDPDISVQEANIDLKGKEVVRDIRDIKDRIEAKTAAGEFFGKTMAAGAEYVDYSAFPELSYSDVVDAIDDARAANPELPQNIAYQIDSNQHVVQFKYLDEELKKNSDVRKKIKSVIQEIIQDDMTDREKVVAINQYIVDHAVYNDAAYEVSKSYNALLGKEPKTEEDKKNMADLLKERDSKYASAWEVSGVLLEGIGVCQSYALTFDALAKEAGVKSAYVRGDAGGPHAWNLVKIDGQWLAMDVTWNDNDQQPNRYLMLSLDDPLYSQSHYVDPTYKERLGLP